jgi:hypothetical protein
MISIPTNSIKQTLQQYLLQYKAIFKKRSFNIFCLLVIGIIAIEEIRSIKFIHDNFISKYFGRALNSIYYFLSYSKFSLDLLTKTTVKIVLSMIPEEIKESMTVFLTIDDTLQGKFGTKFDCYQKHFDHANKTGSKYLNGHCFVSLVVNIPLPNSDNGIRYLPLPVGYRVYDGKESKLKIAASLIDIAMDLLKDYQVILLCDSWYPKSDVLKTVKNYNNLDLIAAVRSDTAIYELPLPQSGKRGRPSKHGQKINYKSFDYAKEGDYYIATAKVITRLFEEPVYLTVTTTDIEEFKSVKVFISTIASEEILITKDNQVPELEIPKDKEHLTHLFIYKLRWNVEVLFYQHKFFWSFGNYMVRNKQAIETYVNLLSVSFTLVSVLPFMEKNYAKYRFESPQTIKRVISSHLMQELILGSFVEKLKTTEIYYRVKEAVATYLDKNDAA